MRNAIGRDEAFIENVVTLPIHGRCGIARRMMERALAQAYEKGCYKVMLLSGAQNTDAHAFYEALGFDRSKVGFQARSL